MSSFVNNHRHMPVCIVESTIHDSIKWLALLKSQFMTKNIQKRNFFFDKTKTMLMQMFIFRSVDKVLQVSTVSPLSQFSFLTITTKTSTTSKTTTSSRTRTTTITKTTSDSFASTSHSGTTKGLRRWFDFSLHSSPF